VRDELQLEDWEEKEEEEVELEVDRDEVVI
jgi:hypothetical protein